MEPKPPTANVFSCQVKRCWDPSLQHSNPRYMYFINTSTSSGSKSEIASSICEDLMAVRTFKVRFNALS